MLREHRTLFLQGTLIQSTFDNQTGETSLSEASFELNLGCPNPVGDQPFLSHRQLEKCFCEDFLRAMLFSTDVANFELY